MKSGSVLGGSAMCSRDWPQLADSNDLGCHVHSNGIGPKDLFIVEGIFYHMVFAHGCTFPGEVQSAKIPYTGTCIAFANRYG